MITRGLNFGMGYLLPNAKPVSVRVALPIDCAKAERSD